MICKYITFDGAHPPYGRNRILIFFETMMIDGHYLGIFHFLNTYSNVHSSEIIFER